MSDLQVFSFEPHQVRILGTWDAPWFVAADVCAVLDLSNPTESARGLDDDEKGLRITETLGGEQKLLCVSESGLYALIFRSRKPVAKRFRRWVTSEVLPALRKNGTYTLGEPPTPPKRSQAVLRRHGVQVQELLSSLKWWFARNDTLTGTPEEVMHKIQSTHLGNYERMQDGRLPTSPRMLLERLHDCAPFLALQDLRLEVDTVSGGAYISIYREGRQKPELVKRRRNRKGLERTIVGQAVRLEALSTQVQTLTGCIQGLQDLLETKNG